MSRPLVVTGPTGWIGRALLARLGAEGTIARVRLFGSAAGTIAAPDGTPLPIRPLSTITGADVAGADVVHLAYLTKEKAQGRDEASFLAANRAIDESLRAACAAVPPRALFVASSGAAMLAAQGDPHAYGRAKLGQERTFLEFGQQHGVPVIAARIFALAGPFINKIESYAIAAFLTQGLRAGRIDVAAAHPVFRSYLHVDDLVRLALGLLDRGIGAVQPVDFCGSEILEMGEIAQHAAAAIGLDPAAIARPPLGEAAAHVYLGDPVPMRLLALRLGVPLRSFAVQLRDTAAWLGPRRCPPAGERFR